MSHVCSCYRFHRSSSKQLLLHWLFLSFPLSTLIFLSWLSVWDAAQYFAQFGFSICCLGANRRRGTNEDVSSFCVSRLSAWGPRTGHSGDRHQTILSRYCTRTSYRSYTLHCKRFISKQSELVTGMKLIKWIYNGLTMAWNSASGWIAVTAPESERLLLRSHAPEEAGLCLRDPPLLPHIVSVKGPRIRKSPAYRMKKPQVLLDANLSGRRQKTTKWLFESWHHTHRNYFLHCSAKMLHKDVPGPCCVITCPLKSHL